MRALVALSEAANALLGLDRAPSEAEGPVENLAQETVVAMRRRGLRINLRPLADARTLVWLPLVWWVGTTLLRVLWWFVCALAEGPGDLGGGGGEGEP